MPRLNFSARSKGYFKQQTPTEKHVFKKFILLQFEKMTCKWKPTYFLVGLILGFPEEADVFDESGFDVLVIHELTENVEFLAEELIREVHLQRYFRPSMLVVDRYINRYLACFKADKIFCLADVRNRLLF